MICIHAETKYTQLKYGTRTNLGVRQDLRAVTAQQVVSSRRLGLLKRVLDSNAAWLLGIIIDQWDAPKGWTKEIRKDFGALAKLEVGVTPTDIQMIAQAKDTTKKRWKVRIKTAGAAAMLMQDTQDDLENIQTFQQAALLSAGLKVGAPPVKVDWARAIAHICTCVRLRSSTRARMLARVPVPMSVVCVRTRVRHGMCVRARAHARACHPEADSCEAEVRRHHSHVVSAQHLGSQ